ncbi:3-demethylubiquinone-9 3-methyltransferase [Devosia geojensis]|uniref:3-demethylubiquinone-9 3-methyltransferase n=1 Tax=Devosia geojensis TaxID=443610 RepID=A0A0F5FXL8_9HYPH|nr:VOC family protein [Devosia geojensis]KKB13320.1 3-demethylubiquinone-9 3-methyltransferase [Devosia geojensis]
MVTRLNPYISFRDTAREAIEFYHSVFGGELTISTFGDFGMSENPADADKIMHSMLETPNGLTLMASDTPPGMDYKPGTNISVSLSGEDEAELRGYWDKLSAGGTVTVPFEKAPWGDTFGMCLDKFGVQWMVDAVGKPQG